MSSSSDVTSSTESSSHSTLSSSAACSNHGVVSSSMSTSANDYRSMSSPSDNIDRTRESDHLTWKSLGLTTVASATDCDHDEQRDKSDSVYHRRPCCLAWACPSCRKRSRTGPDHRRQAATMRERRRLRKVSRASIEQNVYVLCSLGFGRTFSL
jgi:hypothetical protein